MELLKICNEVGAKEYSKGVSLFNFDKVFEFTYRYDNFYYSNNKKYATDSRIINATAFVESSKCDDVYDVSFSCDEKSAHLYSCWCNCPAFSKYYGPCKHVVAAMIYAFYHENCPSVYPGEYMTDYLEGEQLNYGNAVEPARMMRPKRKTTLMLKEMLDKSQEKESERFLSTKKDLLYGQVELIPEFELYLNEALLRFKIGARKKYVLKDLMRFIYAMKKHSKIYYGKELEFTHDFDHFTDESKPLVQFIMNWGVKNERNSDYVYGFEKKNLIMDNEDIANFFNMMSDRTLMINYGGRSSEWKVTKSSPPRSLYIDEAEDGIELKADMPSSATFANQYSVYFSRTRKTVYVEDRDLADEIQTFDDLLYSHSGSALFIAEDDIPLFCQSLLPSIRKFFKVDFGNFDIEKYEALNPEFEIYLDAPQKDFITAKVLSVYSEEAKFNIFSHSSAAEKDRTEKDRTGKDSTENDGTKKGDTEKDIHINRNRIDEGRMKEIVGSWFNAFDNQGNVLVLADDEDAEYRFLKEGIDALQKVATVYISGALKKMQLKSIPTPKFGISISGNLLELSVTKHEVSLDKLAEILSRYDKKKKYYKLKSGEFVEVNDDEFGKLKEIADSLGVPITQIGKGSISLPSYRALYLNEVIDERSGENFYIEKSDEYKKLINNIDKNLKKKWEVPKNLVNTLREYQGDGFRWIKTLAANGFSGILADDMGLGKTLQVIAFLASEFESIDRPAGAQYRTLIVSPASLVYNWASEFEKFMPQLPVYVIAGKMQDREAIIRNIPDKAILITSYDLLKRDTEIYKNVKFDVQIIDEAQFIKNQTTQVSHAVKGIQSVYRLALTGTPIENRVSELWNIFDFLMPGFLFSYQRFKAEIEVPAVQNGDNEALGRLKKMISPFVLRRVKRDVLKDLPDKIEENMICKIEGEQQDLYDAHVQRLRILLNKQSDAEFTKGKIEILAELTKLRQLCCDPSLLYENYKGYSAKNEMCVDLIERAIESGHKVLLFSQFTSMLNILADNLKKKRISFFMLTGETTKEKRASLVKNFNEDDTSVFLISLKAGGTGLNLTAADIVIHYDPWWNVAAQNQATDRAHRIGQTNVVTVYKLIAKGTIEERVVELQEKKKELADKLLSGKEMSSAKLNKEDLLSLL